MVLEILAKVRLTQKQTMLLQLLWPRRGAAGRWTSGREIAAHLGITHTATATMVRLDERLHKAGWMVETSTQGYRVRPRT